MDAPSPAPTASTYDYVFDKDSDQCVPERPQPDAPLSRLHSVVLVNLVLLLVFCFITTLTSGLVFGHKVASNDCLAQSWVMFSSLMGFLYLALHLHAARKGELVDHFHPSFQHPLHSSAIVVARIGTIAWAVSLIIVAVSVSKDAAPVACVNLVACACVTPAMIFLTCVAEKASRPFDLPCITARYSRPPSVVTCRVSTLMAEMMPELTSEDSISRRGSAASHSRRQRPNPHTQHAAAIAAANHAAASTAGHLGGPRAPPTHLKEVRTWSFTRFDDRTKKQLADSVSEASLTSETRARVGGPRPLAPSHIAVKTGVLPPPVCTEPREVHPQAPTPQQQQQQQQQQQHRDPEKAGPDNGGPWRSDWWALRTVAGWVSPAASEATTPGPGPGSAAGRSRAARLSTVAEDWAPAHAHTHAGYQYPPARPPLLRGGPRDPLDHVHAVDDAAAVPRPPPLATCAPPARAPTAARVRLTRAQDALKSQARTRSARVVLTRPQHLTGGRLGFDDDRSARVRPPLQTNLSMPGSFVDE